MSRRATVQICTTPANKQRLEARAAEVDQSLSEYGHELIEAHLASNINVATQSGTRRHMMDTVADLRTDITDTLDEFRAQSAAEIRDMQAVRTAYLIAIWKLLEAEYSAEERRYAMRFAAAHAGIDPALISTGPSPEPEESDELATEALVPALASVIGDGDDQ